MRKITEIIIHCTATRPDAECTVESIRRYHRSIGIAYVGGLDDDGRPADTRTEAQRIVLLQLVRDLMEEYAVTENHGHNEYANKACPCFDVRQWLKDNNL